MKKVNNKKGFTLAELLVVIAILAVLVAIAVPIFGGALSSAEETAINSNYRALRSAGMVTLLTDEGASIRTLTGTNKAWEVTGTVGDDGAMTGVQVKQVAAAGTDSKTPASGVSGDYTVYLVPTDLSAAP